MDSSIADILKTQLPKGLCLDPFPEHPGLDPTVPHAPKRNSYLTQAEKLLSVKNSLRYFPTEYHPKLAKEFLQELEDYGHIYMYRFRPTQYKMQAYPIDNYPAKTVIGRAIQLMIMNNLSPAIAQFPQELITYGGNGSVFSNWVQYLLIMKYLSEMEDDQTLVMNSGHPQGLFPSSIDLPRMVLSNGMMIFNYSSREEYEKYYALGNTMYGEMTAGSYCYIGPQGIVHGTTLTLLNATRKFLNKEDLEGVVYVSSGLGAQGKAGDICKCISVIAEVDSNALEKRLKQGWIQEKITEIPQLIARIKQAKQLKQCTSIGFLGNVVSLWEALAEEPDCIIDLGSDQTSLHNPYEGGYFPVQLSLEEGKKMITENNEKFRELVKESLKRQVIAINKLSAKGMKFWDYGNSFLLEASRAGAAIWEDESIKKFKYPTYFEALMDDIFALGFGPFRWVCTSLLPEDLSLTDKLALEVMREQKEKALEVSKRQFEDNINWISKAEENKLVVGSQARILYADTNARVEIALRFNKAISEGKLKGPVVLSRDHHDVGGTDSPFRETSNIQDGSKFTADMAMQSVIGDAMRGASWVAIHNGGGVGWGEVVNGGFGLVLDGTELAEQKAKKMLAWDVNNGVARRSWSGNKFAKENITNLMKQDKKLVVTLPNELNEEANKELKQILKLN